MKTKHILTAMVLPTLLAACTADEIVENNNNNLVAQGRAEVEAVSFAIDGEGSRLAYNDDNLGWDWEDTDKFLLFPADNGETPFVGTKANPAYPGQRFEVGTNLVTGYEYEKDANGAYTTKAAVMGEGLYWGYAPSFNKTARGLIEYNLATSQDIEYYKSEEAQAFITPLYEVNAEIYNNQLPLEMINWYTTAIFPLKNNTKQDLNLKQIVVRSDEAFLVKGEIDINAMGEYIMAYDGKKWDAIQNYDNDKNNNLDLKKGEFIDEFRQEFMAKKGENGLYSNLLLLNLEGEVLEAGETKTYYMLLPATSGKVNCEIVIMTEEGFVEIESTSQSNYLKNTQIYHNGQKAAFGWQTVNKKNVAKPYSIKSSELIDSDYDVYYIASYKDMMHLINTVNGTFEVINVGDWAVDAAMAEAITESDSEIIFGGNVVIEDTEEIELNKVTFAANVTIKEGTKVTFVEDVNDTENTQWGSITIEEDAELVVEDCNLGGQIFVEDGATLTVNKTADAYASVYNEGEVTLEDQPNVTVYQNGGNLNLTKNAKTGGVIRYSTENIKFPVEKTFTTTLGTGTVLVVEGDDVVLDKNTTKATMATLVVNGDMEMNANLTIKGEMTIEGDTEDVNGDLIVEKGGKLTNNGYVKSDIIVKKGATLYNNDKARDIYNEGLVVAGEDSKSTIVEGVNGRVDNTEGGAVTNTAGQTVYYTLKNGDVDDIEDVDFADWSINTLRVEGTLDMDRPLDVEYWDQLKVLTTLELANNAKVEVNGDIHVAFTTVNLEGNATISGYRSETSSLTFDKNVDVNMLSVSATVNDVTSWYCLTIEDVTVSGVCGSTVTGHSKGDGVITFHSNDDVEHQLTTGHHHYNSARIETEDASLNAKIATDDEVYINGKPAATAYVVGTLAGLKSALDDDSAAKINLHTSVINLDAALTISRDVEIIGGTLAGYSVTVASVANVTFDGVTFKNVTNAKKNASSLYYANGASKLVVKDCVFDGFEWDAIQVTNMTKSAEVTIIGNEFKSPVNEQAIEEGSYVHIANANGRSTKYIKISDNVFGSKRAATNEVKSDFLVKVYGFSTKNTIVGENEYKGGYKNNSVMMTPAMDYDTAAKNQKWTRREMYNAMVGENVRISDIEADLMEAHTDAENL